MWISGRGCQRQVITSSSKLFANSWRRGELWLKRRISWDGTLDIRRRPCRNPRKNRSKRKRQWSNRSLNRSSSQNSSRRWSRSPDWQRDPADVYNMCFIGYWPDIIFQLGWISSSLSASSWKRKFSFSSRSFSSDPWRLPSTKTARPSSKGWTNLWWKPLKNKNPM